MKKKSSDKPTTGRRRAVAEMRKEYDFSDGVRGKYVERHARGMNVVVLDADVAAAFPTSESVNRALRALLEIVPVRVPRRRRPRPA